MHDMYATLEVRNIEKFRLEQDRDAAMQDTLAVENTYQAQLCALQRQIVEFRQKQHADSQEQETLAQKMVSLHQAI